MFLVADIRRMVQHRVIRRARPPPPRCSGAPLPDETTLQGTVLPLTYHPEDRLRYMESHDVPLHVKISGQKDGGRGGRGLGRAEGGTDGPQVNMAAYRYQYLYK
jgi:hypothetical protein